MTAPQKNDFCVNQKSLCNKVIIVFLIIHILMLIYDITHPEIFLHADRASYRSDMIQGFITALNNGNVIEFLSSKGMAGDYLFHALLFFSIGKVGLIIFQIVITLFAGYAVYGLSRFLGFRSSMAAIASAIYLALPHTLILPHQLATEPMHCSLLVISLWLIAKFWSQGKELSLVGSAIIAGVATFIRPITMLWPFIPSAVLFFRRKKISAITYIALAFMPIVIWMTFMLVNTGHFTMGESNRNMGRNLYQRILHITYTMDDEGASQIKEKFLTQGEKGSLSPQQYFLIMINYPVAFIHYAIRDTLVFAFKSGIERVTIDYFTIGNTDLSRKFLQGATGWRYMLEKEGIIPTLMFALKTQGLIFGISLVGAALMAALTMLAFLGTFRMVIDWKRLDHLQRSISTILILLPFYIWLFSQIVPGVQSRHRAPAEAAIVLLATYGMIWLLDTWSSFKIKNKSEL